MKYGFVRVAAAVPHTIVADCLQNAAFMKAEIDKAHQKKAEVIVFPELCMTSYTCADLFFQSALLNDAEHALEILIRQSANLDTTVIVGMPVAVQSVLYNCAIVFSKGQILGIVPKTYLPNYQEFYEQRWFHSGKDIRNSSATLCGQTVPFGTDLLFKTRDFTFAIEICEDLWAAIAPSCSQTLNGAEVIFNLSADNDLISKHKYLQNMLAAHSAKCLAGYVYTSCGFGESTTDIVFGGKSLIYENGTLLAQSERFSLATKTTYADIDIEMIRHERMQNTTYAANAEMHRTQYRTVAIDTCTPETSDLLHPVNPTPFIPVSEDMNEKCEEIFSIQTSGLAKRIVHTRARNVVVGISGGLDSTLALLVCVKTFDKLGLPRKGITGVTMPGFGTTDRTHTNATTLMQSLGIDIREIPIKNACIQHFKDIDHDITVHDVTYENSQARERTQILMDIANQTGGLVVGTGDLSELALGWATYNGDHMSMYGVNAGVPKTLVKYLVRWVADNEMDNTSKATLIDIIDTPISPELIPADENGQINQKTEDLVGPYELHDFFIYNMLRHGFAPNKILYLANIAFEGKYNSETIEKWLRTCVRRFFTQQFKRSCLPDGPKIGSVSLSPRGDLRMPSDASYATWTDNIDNQLLY